jgi:mono/diheme cytochrome c family protein
VIKRKSVLGRFCALNLACATSFIVGCGSDGSEDPVVENDPPSRPIETCDDNPYQAQCKPPEVPEGTGGSSSGPKEEKPKPPTQADLARAAAENVLEINCGNCHGSKLKLEEAQGRMNYIDDMKLLVDNEKVKPLDSEGSFIIQRMRDRTMPPAGSGLTVSQADIDLVASFIDNPDFWPGVVPQADCKDNPAISFDDLYAEVADQLSGEDDEDQPFIRYISLANRVTAGVCTNTALDRDRHALIKMMNMLSVNAKVTEPEAMDTEKTLYRIDLRQFDWNREIVVNGVTFPDVWEAIVADNDYAVPFVGEDADDAKEDALTDVPVMFLDSMLDTAIIGNLYYAIIDVDVTLSIDTFISDVLEVDVDANREQEEVYRAGTNLTRVSRQDRLVEGQAIDIRPGVLYQSFDFADAAGNDNIFENPFGFNEGGREAIFTLPNGMLAYLIADANGTIVEESEILLDSNQGNFRALTATSCSSCHAGGLIPLVDKVRESVEANAIDLIANGTLSQDELQQLKAIYLEPKDFEAQVADDSEFYLDALERANLPIKGADPVSSQFIRFDRDITLRDAAGDLGLSPDDLDNQLNSLNARLQVLRELPGPNGTKVLGTFDRDDFTGLYVETLCALSVTLDNRPDDAICAALDQ